MNPLFNTKTNDLKHTNIQLLKYYILILNTIPLTFLSSKRKEFLILMIKPCISVPL